MDNIYSNKMTNKTDAELFEYVYDKTKFHVDIMIAAINELENRGKSNSELISIRDHMLSKIEKKNQQLQQSKYELDLLRDIPKSITNAAKLIYLSLGIGIINSVLMELTTDYNNISDPKSLIILVCSLGLMVFFAYKIHIGKKWARTTFLILFLIGLIMFPFTLIQFFNLNPIAGVVSLIQTGLQVYALILLFRPDSKDWYLKKGKISNDQ